MKDELGRLNEGILPDLHRCRTRMTGRAGEGTATTDVADDRGDDTERSVGGEQRRPLLDVQLDVRVG